VVFLSAAEAQTENTLFKVRKSIQALFTLTFYLKTFTVSPEKEEIF